MSAANSAWTHRRSWQLAVAVAAACAGSTAFAGPSECTPSANDPSVLICTNDQSQGIALQVPRDGSITTLVVRDLESVIVTHNRAGVAFDSNAGGRITIDAGRNPGDVQIETSGDGAAGIVANSRGGALGISSIPALDLLIPAGAAGPGGPVTVNNQATIATFGNAAHGISANNVVSAYHPSVMASLESFSIADHDFAVHAVAGSTDNVGKAVAGSDGGTFTLNADGTVSFDPGDDFEDPPEGEQRSTSVEYTVFANGQELASATFTVVRRWNVDGELETIQAADFPQFAVGGIKTGDPATDRPLFPDMQQYVDGLLADAGRGGGSGVVGRNAGSITTGRQGESIGSGARGISLETVGGTGSAGRDGCFFCGEPSPGGDGGNGAALSATNDGSIVTYGAGAAGIVVNSRGGTGGEGGEGSTWYGGRRGGNGGVGGNVIVEGRGSIVTHGDRAIGVLAISEGGIGGNGGAGEFVHDAATGGSGGRAGIVTIDASMDITTGGDAAHAIWGKSIGGSGGTGGHDGWAGGDPGSGGEATDGGNVSVHNGGALQTNGAHAHGIYGQSVGGFGGDGGVASNLFAAFGGHGASAGSGGTIEIHNTSSGSITTTNQYSHAIFAQSVGGGGGSGGDGSALFSSLGGGAGAGGHGGTVVVENDGAVRTEGLHSRGIFAQSVGGGGGDGGNSRGLIASIGGSGGTASHAGEVSVSNSGTIDTVGADATAIYVQSIGGGGGSGGDSGGIVSIGGAGGGGGMGGDVAIVNDGEINTEGNLSRAIFAQSIGGGGGDGGGAGGLVSIGGDGGAAGHGGEIRVSNNGSLTTSGLYSFGIQAQSVGGGGGSGAGTGAWFASLGGKGNAGGDGRLVDVENSGTLATEGDFSYGIFAQSVGGGGGNGGGSIAQAVAIGGDGGAGGRGGDVSVRNTGSLTTRGLAARGVHAESVGGGGGTGAGTGAVLVSLGGDGGEGSAGGAIDVLNSGSVDTTGHFAHALYATSVGGGGGSASSAGGVGFGFNLTLGGDGGAGASGGTVDVRNDGSLVTRGHGASGIFAESVGGGGGNGGNVTSLSIGANLSFGIALGGDGGGAGLGNTVTVENSGSIDTFGSSSHGVFAHSVGGSGGAGGNAFSYTIGAGVIEEIPIAINASIAIGGDGGAGGNGGIVDVDHQGDIWTRGFRSYGVFAQSVGGSGGDGGNSTSVALSINMDISGSVAIGGDGGGAGLGNDVTVASSGTVRTDGAHSTGIFAQSVGGSGGAGGDATTVKVDLSFPSSAEDLIPMPSGSFDVAIGGDGGAGGHAGAVEVSGAGTVETHGAFASGIFAQSVGGGGGAGGDARSIEIDLSANPTDFVPFIDILQLSTRLVIGGDGGEGGNGGDVMVDSAADISTAGEFAHGLVAQSVGGGGGAGGSAITLGFATELPDLPDVPVLDDIVGLANIEMVMQGGAGAAGLGGNVEVTNRGSIRTSGDFAYGIVAQSVAGGGGLAGIANPHGVTSTQFGSGMRGLLTSISGSGASFAGSLGGDGDAGAVSLQNTGNIWTRGDGAHGIVAQSAAGTGSAGAVKVVSSGNILTEGSQAHGIHAESVAAGGSGPIELTLEGSVVATGAGSSAIFLSGGTENVVANRGAIGRHDLLTQTAITGGDGNETVTNFGTLAGNLQLGAGTNTFSNSAGATFVSGTTVGLGPQGSALNAGTWSIGDLNSLATTTVQGSVVQSSSGVLLMDYDHAIRTADRLQVEQTAELTGSVAINQLNAGWTRPGTTTVSLGSAAGGFSVSDLSLTASPSLITQYALRLSPTDLSLEIASDFLPHSLSAGMTADERAVGEYLNKVQSSGGSVAMTSLIESLVAIAEPAALRQAYDQLSPAGYSSVHVSQVAAGMHFADALLSCKSRDGDFRFVAEQECRWLSISTSHAQRNADTAAIGYERDADMVSGGRQWAVGDGWYAGFAASIDRDRIRTRTLAGFGSQSAEGRGLHVGLVLKGASGNTTWAASLSGSLREYDTERGAYLASAAHSDQDIFQSALQLRLAHAFDYDRWYMRPVLDAGVTRVELDGFHERRAWATNLIVAGSDDNFWYVRPAMEAGFETPMGDALARFSARFGVTRLLSGGNVELSASFEGAPPDSGSFHVTQAMDRTVRELAAGVDVFTSSGFVLRLGYSGQSSANGTSNGGFVKFSWPVGL